MTMGSVYTKKNKPSKIRFQNRFSTYKSSPVEENDRIMRRFETAFNCNGKPWHSADENEINDRVWLR